MRIGIVNDLAIVTEALRRALALEPAYRVVWVAADGDEAVARCARETPDLILMDLLMPGMGGVEAIRRIMSATPCAIVVVTASVGGNAARVFEALGQGALDAIDTPVLEHVDTGVGIAPLLAKIEMIRKLISEPGDVLRRGSGRRNGASSRTSGKIVAIGASAGGPAALVAVLSALPEDFPAPIVVLQHLDQHFTSELATWLDGQTTLHVRIAEKGDSPEPGIVYLADSTGHLTLKTATQLTYTQHPRDHPYRPSIDVFFHCLSRLWHGQAIGVLLTGMGRDGALGLKALRERGHQTIAQDEATSAVYGMPKAAAAIGAANEILALGAIAPRLTSLLSAGRDRKNV